MSPHGDFWFYVSEMMCIISILRVSKSTYFVNRILELFSDSNCL